MLTTKEFIKKVKELGLLGMSTRSQAFGFQTQFTQEEIDEIKEKFGVTLSDFEQIRVEDDEEEKYA